MCGDGGDGGGTGGEEPGTAAVAAAEATATAEAAQSAADVGVVGQEAADTAASNAAVAESVSDTSPESGTPQGIFGGPASMINPTPVGVGITALGLAFPGFGVVAGALQGFAMGLEAMGATPAPGTSSDPQASPGEGFDAPGAPEGEGGDPDLETTSSAGAAPTTIQTIQTSPPGEERTTIVAQTLPVVPPLFSEPIPSSLSVTTPTSPAALVQSQIVAEQEGRKKGAAALKAILNNDPEKKGFESTIRSTGSNTISSASLFSSRLFPKSQQIGAA